MVQASTVCFLLVLHLLLTGMVHAQPTGDGFWSVQLENDLWGSNDDRFYTHGTKVSFAYGENPPDWLQSVVDNLPFYQQGGLVLHGYEIGQTIFTPEDITQPSLIENDRPYAGWLYLNTGIGHIFSDRGDREEMNFLLLTTGLVGPSSLAEESQDLVHNIFNATEPLGWNNQLKNELGLNATYLRRWRRINDFDEPRQTEINYHAALTLGNIYSFAAAGIMARYGTHLKTDIGPPTILPGFPGAPAFNPNRQSNWYVFAGIDVRAVARNIFLDGNTFRDSHSVDKKNMVFDLLFGVAFHFNDMRISFSQLLRSCEFEGQAEPSLYGAINLTVFSD